MGRRLALDQVEPTHLLLACALIYALIGEPADGLILLAFVGLIALLDAWQQRRSRRALEALARLSAPRAWVRRQGVELELPAEAVQVGDQLRLEEGDRVAADGRLLEAVGLWLDTSLLTGESLPVAAQAGDHDQARVLAGSLVASGRGWLAVEAVGEATSWGQLGVSLRQVSPPETRLQRQTRRLTATLTRWALLVCLGLALLQWSGGGDGQQALLGALALALALLPNEIPVVLALFLALGALRLSTIGVLARWPAAVESLGSATVLAVDKTGTLTENRMAVQVLQVWPSLECWVQGEPLLEPFHPLLERAVLASRSDPVEAMERAIQRLAATTLSGSEHLHPDWPPQRDYPLQDELLVVSRLWKDGAGHWQLAAKGAPEAIVGLCHLPPHQARPFLEAAEQLAATGLRVLAVAQGEKGAALHQRPGGLGAEDPPGAVHAFLFQPIGLIGLADPLRPEVPAAIAAARRAGVRVVMITGDGPVTARAIADQAGLPAGEPLLGEVLDRLDPGELARQIAAVPVFARVRPEQKLRLVQALQAAGDVVAMTGDGVNDAPALKAADIGVAMGERGTAVARESADLVLLRDSFADLVGALALGRRVARNLERALAYTLAVHLPIAGLSLWPLLGSGHPLILLPVHIALLHLVIDPACTVVLEAQPGGPTLLQRPPRSRNAPLLSTRTLLRATVQGGAVLMAVLALLVGPLRIVGPLVVQRTAVVGLLLLTGAGLVLLHGDRRQWITAAGVAIGPGLGVAIMASPGLRQLLGVTWLSASQLGTVLLLTALAVGLAIMGSFAVPSQREP